MTNMQRELAKREDILPDQPFKMGHKGLEIHGNPSFEQWYEYGQGLRAVQDRLQWFCGDWLNYGEYAYGEKYSQFFDPDKPDIHREAQTLANWAWVCREFEVSRRRENLSFSHHAEVAALEPVEQDEWLDRAEIERWPVTRLRQELRGKKPPATPKLTCPACGYEWEK